MSRRNKLFIWLAGIVALMALTYASSPWLLAGLVKRNLSAWDLDDIQVSASYPGWRGLRLHKLQFTTVAGEHNFSFQFTDVDVGYRIPDLVTGTVAHIRMPVAVASVRPAAGSVQTARTTAAQSLAALVSGQWLSKLPVRELLLEQLTINGRTPSDAVYTIQLSGHIRDAEAQVSGKIKLPTLQKNQLAFSFTAHKTGEMRLALSPSANATKPMLEWAVHAVAIDQDQIKANGMLHAKFQPLAPVLKVWSTEMGWLTGLEGDFNSQWHAILPAESSGDAVRLTLSQLQGQGSNWDVAGEARVHGLGGEQPLSLKLVELAGRYEDLDFVGLSADVELAIGEGLRTTKDARLNVDLLDVGFPIKNFAVRFQLAQHPGTKEPIARIEKFTADLLGGRAFSAPFELDLGKDRNQFVVQLEGIGLNDILQLEQQEGLKGTGVLDGQIPIEITRDGIRVVQGKLSARAPGGNIRYMPTESVLSLVQSNPSLNMVFGALGNFQYHELDVTSDYKPEGTLTLQVHLKGKNPDWQAGQPVDLNLNLEENIPALLRSLQLSGEITERVRKYYKNTP